MNRPLRDTAGRFASADTAYQPERFTQELACVAPSKPPDGLLLADGYEEALVGYFVPLAGGALVAVYNRAKCLEILEERDGMEPEEAEEYFAFNTEAAYVGPRTPMYLDLHE